MKVAIVVDHLKEYGGAERWVEAMKELWPEASIFTSFVRFDRLPPSFRAFEIHASFLQRFCIHPWLEKLFVPLFPLAFAHFNFDAYDMVLSSHAFFSTSIVVRPQTKHICYCHTPPRFLWGYPVDVSWQNSTWFRALLSPLAMLLRMHDYLAAQRVDVFVTNSQNVRRRIRKFYRLDALVAYCGYDVTASVILSGAKRSRRILSGSPFLLVVSRLVAYKNVHLAIQACNRLKKNLVIAGDGPERQNLKSIAGDTITFLGRVDDTVLVDLYHRCAAVIFGGEEDFGNVPVEAMMAGKPVIAFGRGGALETVIAGKTGTFFQEQTMESLTDALASFDPSAYDPEACRVQAEKFSKSQFLLKMKHIVGET
ncbi:MAG: glycosyltransferase [bacterium]|nr:glycosyltransferase [bacterium]